MIIYAYKQHIPHDIAEAVEAVDPTWAIGKSETRVLSSMTIHRTFLSHGLYRAEHPKACLSMC